MIEIAPNFSARSLWKAPDFGAYFMTPIVQGGCLYGCAGQSPRLAELVCYDFATGQEKWRNDLGGRLGRASLLKVGDEVLCLGEFGDLRRAQADAGKAHGIAPGAALQCA